VGCRPPRVFLPPSFPFQPESSPCFSVIFCFAMLPVTAGTLSFFLPLCSSFLHIPFRNRAMAFSCSIFFFAVLASSTFRYPFANLSPSLKADWQRPWLAASEPKGHAFRGSLSLASVPLSCPLAPVRGTSPKSSYHLPSL